MNALALTLALLPQGSPSHAELHPGDLDLFFEVGGIPGVLEAFDEAPLVRTLRDEEIRGFLESLGGYEDVHPRVVAGRWLGASFPGADLGAFVEAVDSLSFSIRLSARGDAEAGGQEGESDGLVVRAVADFHTPELAAAAHAALVGLAGVEGEEAADTRRLTWDFAPSTPCWSGVRGARLFVDFGAPGAPLDPEGWQGELAASSLFERGRQAFTDASGATVLWCVQRRSPLDVFTMLEPELASLGGGGGLLSDLIPFGGERLWRMQLRGDRFVTESFAEGNGARVPFDTSFLNRLPAEAMFVYGGSLDGARIARSVRASLFGGGSNGASEAPALDEEAWKALDALVAKLGSNVAVSVLPFRALGLPDWYAWFDLKEPDGFAPELAQFVDRLGPAFPGFSGRTRDYKVKNAAGERVPFPITTLSLPPDAIGLGPMATLSPAFTTAEGKLLVGSSSVSVKRELKRLYGAEPAVNEGADALSAHGFSVPADAHSVFFMDWGLQIETAFGLLKALSGLAG